MQGIASFNPAAAAKCPYLRGLSQPGQQQPESKESPTATAGDCVSISPFEPADSGALTKTCVRSGAQATMAALPGFAKAGCPHAG
jgi:hypothetical protein